MHWYSVVLLLSKSWAISLNDYLGGETKQLLHAHGLHTLHVFAIKSKMTWSCSPPLNPGELVIWYLCINIPAYRPSREQMMNPCDQTYLRDTSPSIAIVPRLEKGPPGQVHVIMTATAWFGPRENASVTQNATSGSRIYWHPIPTRIDHGRFKWSTKSLCFTLQPEQTINKMSITIAHMLTNMSTGDFAPWFSNETVSFVEALLSVKLSSGREIFVKEKSWGLYSIIQWVASATVPRSLWVNIRPQNDTSTITP